MSGPTPPRRRRIAGERRRPEDLTQAPPAASPDSPEGPASDVPLEPASAVETDGGARTAAEPSDVPDEQKPKPRAVPRWAFASALVAALTLVTTALVLGLVTWDYREVRQQERIQETQDDAAAAAERAAAAVLSFKHDTLDADLQAASRFLSSSAEGEEASFRETYTETFETNVRPRALESKATVTAKVLASAVVNASEQRAQILVYVDQTTVSTLNSGRPQVALNRTTFDMVLEGGSWLVADITSY